MKALSACRICQSADLRDVLDLGVMAMSGVFPRSRDEEVKSGPLNLVQCGDCSLVQLGHSYDLAAIYGDNYGYRSGLNGAMVRHLHGLVRDVEILVGLRPGDTVVDIGSNDGTLLGGYGTAGLRKIGIDPTATKFRAHYGADVTVVPDFFSADTLAPHMDGRKAGVITSIAMFYDLENPGAFVRDVRDCLADDGVWVFEQSHLPAMVEANAYDAVCHEHLEYYTVERVEALLRLHGLKIVDLTFNDVNGGSFRVMAAKQCCGRFASLLQGQAYTVEIVKARERCLLLDRFQDHVEAHRDMLVHLLDGIRQQGKTVLGYGASTKGNVLLQYCGIGPDLVPAIAEVNEDKFGCFTPGTGIPIVSETEARAMAPDYFLVLPWHFAAGIVERERAFLRDGGALIFPLPSLEVVT